MSAATRKVKLGYATPIANKALVVWEETGPSSYATGGYTITAESTTTALNSLGLRGFDAAGGGMDTTAGYEVILGPASSGSGPGATLKVLWRVANTGAEVGNGTDLSAKKAACWAIGG